MCELYKVDPDGDLIIILTVGHDQQISADAHGDASTDSLAHGPTIEHQHTGTPDPDDGLHEENTNTVGCTSAAAHESRFRVSSKHLTLASRLFRTMLSGDWAEGQTVYPDGHQHVDLKDFDPQALQILLNVLHGKTRRVPRSLDLETLAEVAKLVDYFGCHEEVEVFSDMWVQEVEGSPRMSMGSDNDRVLLTLVSIVFNKPALFKQTTRAAILRETGPMSTSGLPVPGLVDERVNRERNESLNQLFEALYGLVDELRKENTSRFGERAFEHDAMLLGALLKQMSQHGFPWSRPEAPYSGFSFAEVAQSIRSFQSLGCVHDKYSSDVWGFEQGNPYGNRKKGCKSRRKFSSDALEHTDGASLQCLLHPKVEHLENGINGLDIADCT